MSRCCWALDEHFGTSALLSLPRPSARSLEAMAQSIADKVISLMEALVDEKVISLMEVLVDDKPVTGVRVKLDRLTPEDEAKLGVFLKEVAQCGFSIVRVDGCGEVFEVYDLIAAGAAGAAEAAGAAAAADPGLMMEQLVNASRLDVVVVGGLLVEAFSERKEAEASERNEAEAMAAEDSRSDAWGAA